MQKKKPKVETEEAITIIAKFKKELYQHMPDYIRTMNKLKGITFTFIDENTESAVQTKSSNALSELWNICSLIASSCSTYEHISSLINVI